MFLYFHSQNILFQIYYVVCNHSWQIYKLSLEIAILAYLVLDNHCLFVKSHLFSWQRGLPLLKGLGMPNKFLGKIFFEIFLQCSKLVLGGCMVWCLNNHVTRLILGRGMHFKVNITHSVLVLYAILGLKTQELDWEDIYVFFWTTNVYQH